MMRKQAIFLFATLVIVIIGGADVLVHEFASRKITPADTSTAPTTTTTTLDAKRCYGSGELVIGFYKLPPIVDEDVAQNKTGLAYDVLTDRLHTVGCDLKWREVVPTSPDVSGIDLMVGTPKELERLVAEQKWSKTSPYAVIKLATIKRNTINLDTTTGEVWVDHSWAPLTKALHPTAHVIPKTAAEAVSGVLDLHNASVTAAVIQDSADLVGDERHPKNTDNIELWVAVNPRYKQHLEALSRVLAPATDDGALEKAMAKNAIHGIAAH